MLRDSLLTSSILCNSETWYNITKAEMELLETVDTLFLQRILKAPKSTPKEMFYLELGCLPYRNLIQKRRLMFLFYILKQDPKTMIYKFFESQKNHGTSKDWVNTVTQDLKDLKIDKNFDDIKLMKKQDFRRIVSKSIQKNVMQSLEDKKSKHSKVKQLKHEIFGMQKYLRKNNMKISIEEKQMIFKLRSEVTNVKMNFKGMHEDLKCKICNYENETQKHLLECKILNENEKQILEYEKIENGNIIDMVQIVRKFRKIFSYRD